MRDFWFFTASLLLIAGVLGWVHVSAVNIAVEENRSLTISLTSSQRDAEAYFRENQRLKLGWTACWDQLALADRLLRERGVQRMGKPILDYAPPYDPAELKLYDGDNEEPLSIVTEWSVQKEDQQ